MPYLNLSTYRLLITVVLLTFSPTCILGGNSSAPCSTLASLLHGKVSYPYDKSYTASILSYFFQEARLAPSCIVSPASSSDVSLIVNTIVESRKNNSKSTSFAIRSGGHAPVAGAANINDGVTIDLRAMKSITINQNHTVTSVGAGSLWQDVYQKVEAMNLSVVGARVAGLGVGGLITGGGISFFSPQKGFACDNVVNMEVVLANGEIVYANNTENADLFTALKGGSNNFGIVTRFDLRTYSGGDFWGGFIFYPGSTVNQQLQAFEDFMTPANFDPYAEMICAIGYEGAIGNFVASNGIYYTKPIANPPVFQPFTSIQPQLGTTMRISNLTDFVTEEASQQAVNSRGIYVNTVFRPNLSLLEGVYNLWNSTVGSIKNVAGIQYFLIFQRVPAVIPGNSLGLNPSDGPLVLTLLSITWNDAKDDALIDRVAKDLISRIEVLAKAAGLFKEYKYLNYAANFQNPIASYGPASLENLREVSRKYDPTGVFQNRVPGGFKLFFSK